MAAVPAFFSLNPDIWVKVATNVKVGVIHRIVDTGIKYYYTYVATAATAPTAGTGVVGIPAFTDSSDEIFTSVVELDIYLMAVGSKGRVAVGVEA